MPTESWIAPDDAPEMAAHATAVIDAALVGTGLARDAYWAAVRKGYNTPYNDPPRKNFSRGRALPVAASDEVPLPPGPASLPVAAMTLPAAEARAV